MCSARSKCLLTLIAMLAMAIAGATRYVNANQATGNHDGSSWTNAYQDLQQALAVAQEGDEIWVAKSMPAQPAYIPSVRYPYNPNDPNEPNDPRRVTFRIPAGVKVYGGFRGYDDYTDPNTPFPGETSLAERDPEHNLTILDGDVNQNDSLLNFPYGVSFADNAYHVVFFHGTDTQFETPTKLSGVVIRNGHADGIDEYANYFGIPDDMGGGVITQYVLFGPRSYPRLDRLLLDHNYADVAGAGILLSGKATTALANCRFERNWVGDPNKPNIYDGHGAGLAVHREHGGPTTLQNAIFYENHIVRGTGAGIFYPNIAGDSWANLTFYGNVCDAPPSGFELELAGAFYCPPNAGSHELEPSAQINNCIVWNNTEPQLGAAVDACYSDVQDSSWWQEQGPTPCLGTSIAATPVFRNAAAGNVTVCYSSPCIDAGNTLRNDNPNLPLVLADLTDLDENGNTSERMPREMLYPRGRVLATQGGGQIDMGAYELSACPGDIDGNGAVDIADLSILLSAFGQSCNSYPYDPSVCDLDCDSSISITDLAALLSAFGTTCSGLDGGAGAGENEATTELDPLTEWLRSATPQEVLDWWFNGQPPVGGDDR